MTSDITAHPSATIPLPGSKPTVKQHLSAIRQCFDWLVTGGVLDTNPAASVKGPKYVIKKGKTPVLDTEQTRALLVPATREGWQVPRSAGTSQGGGIYGRLPDGGWHCCR